MSFVLTFVTICVIMVYTSILTNVCTCAYQRISMFRVKLPYMSDAHL